MSTGVGPSSEPEGGVSHPINKPFSEVIARGADALPPLPVDESAAVLELRLQKETDSRQQDRFYSIAIGTVLIDMAVFPHQSAIGIVCIFLLELIILLGLAKQLGNEHVTILLDYLFHQWLSEPNTAGTELPSRSRMMTTTLRLPFWLRPKRRSMRAPLRLAGFT
jgi:hypothetical protein